VTCDVTVHVTDVNDNSPRWSEPTPTVVNLAENRNGANGSAVVSLTASDIDVGHNATVTYSLYAGLLVRFCIRVSHYTAR